MPSTRRITIETERFVLSEFDIEDAELLYVLNRHDVVLRYTGDPPFDSVEATRRFVQDYDAYARLGFGRWSVHEKATQRFAGWCGLSRAHPQGDVDLGFRFLPDVWGRGYATECAQATLRYAFDTLGLTRVIGRAHPDNHASLRVLEKCGMRFEEAIEAKDGAWMIYAVHGDTGRSKQGGEV